MEIPVLAVTDSTICYTYSLTSIGNFLLDQWKTGAGEIGKSLPRYQPAAAEQVPEVDVPSFAVCKVVDNHLTIPQEVRSQFLQDPIRAPEWRQMLQNFDSKWAEDVSGRPAPAARPSSQSQTQAANTGANNAAEEHGAPETDAVTDTTTWNDVFPEEPKTKAELEAKYQLAHQFSVNNNVTGIITEGPKLFLVGSADSELPSDETILTFGAGSWLLDNKATAYEEDRGSKETFFFNL